MERKKLKTGFGLFVGIFLAMAAIFISLIIVFTTLRVTVLANGLGYNQIEQVENQEVIAITEEVGGAYGICPELLQAICFYESSNQSGVINAGGDMGYMQVNPKWHQERMERLDVSDLEDGYSNILVATDYLMELAEEYEDLGMVLMVYNGDSQASELYDHGKVSSYAQKILMLSSELERLHGK